MKTQYDGQSVNWKFGHCNNARQYDDYREYIQRCCLNPGKHTLTCINNDKPDGWKNSRLSIQGVDFCHDFMSFKVFRQITVEGTSIFRNTHILWTNNYVYGITPRYLTSFKLLIIGVSSNSTIGSPTSPTDKNISSQGKSVCR